MFKSVGSKLRKTAVKGLSFLSYHWELEWLLGSQNTEAPWTTETHPFCFLGVAFKGFGVVLFLYFACFLFAPDVVELSLAGTLDFFLSPCKETSSELT